MKYGKRSFWGTVLSSKLTLLGACVLVIILGRATWNIYAKARASTAALERMQGETARLEERRDDLAAKVGRLSTDQGLEAEIRARYHAVRQGESVAVIISDDTAAVVDASATQATTTLGWWGRMLQAIGF